MPPPLAQCRHVSSENVSCENLSGDAATESLWSVGQVKGHKKPKVYLAY